MPGIEIDFLPVGDGSKSGDAIAMRVGNDFTYEIVVVDGGNLASGKNAVEHINEKFNNPKTIHHVVCTHQDGDHASGLRPIIENFKVNNLWIHQPWLHAAELVDSFRYRWSEQGLADHLRNDAFPIVASLCDLAQERGVTLREPFQGQMISSFRVLAPGRERFLSMVPQMGQTPQARTTEDATVLGSLFKVIKEAVLNVMEGWGVETLGTPSENATSVTNQSSVVLLGNFDGRRVLLTGDAGVAALEDAVQGANLYGDILRSPDLIQVPHHGSRRNVSPAVLDMILGPKLDAEGENRGLAISSVAAKADGFPRKVVENAFTRRGYKCFDTKKGWANYNHGFSERAGVSPMIPNPFHTMVEE